MNNLRQELEELGLGVQISQETAEEQWKQVAREYRIVGEKAEALSAIRRDMVIAIMCGDIQIETGAAGVSIRQFVKHPQGGGPAEIVYNPPNAKHVAAGGTDAATLATKWTRIAAALSGNTEGQLTLWLAGRDHALMESIVQLFITA